MKKKPGNLFCQFIFFLLMISAAFPLKLSGGEPQEPLHHNPWELIIYRPENSGGMNSIRCWLKIEDESGTDVTYSAARATYEWVSVPDVINHYEKTYYLSGGMAMHLLIKPGKYVFRLYTPPEHQFGAQVRNKKQWESNAFFYDTQNPAKVIFVSPVANENGFYSGGWHISSKAPLFWKYTKPKQSGQ